MTHHRHRALAVGLLVLYFVAAVHMAFALPAHATPNELLNFEYIQVMRQIRGLPNRGLVDSEVRYTEWHQPPVYFTFAALYGLALPVPPSAVNPPPPIVVADNPHYLSTPRGNLNPVIHIDPANTPLLYTSRVAAALLGALGVAALYAAGRRVYGPAAGLLMASLLAFQPTYLHLSGSVNNDMPLTAVVAIVMAYAVILLDDQQRTGGRLPLWRYALLGLLCAAAILTKANGVFVLVFPAVTLLGLLIAARPRAPGRWLLAAAATAAGLLPLWAGWLWLNTVRMRDTLGLSGSLPVDRVLRLSPLDFSHIAPFLPAVWRSYWLDWSAGDVGYGPAWLYWLWLGMVAVMLLGWLKYRGPGGRASEGEMVARPARGLINLMVLLAFLGISYLYFAVKALTVKEAGWMVPEGRWWLPGLPMLAWLLAAGFARWWSSPRRQNTAALLAAAVPPVLAFGLLAWHLPALFPAAERITPHCEPQPSAIGAPPPPCPPAPLLTYGPLGLISATAEPAAPGQPTTVVLTWQAKSNITTDYTISTQLLAPAPDGWLKLAEHNSFPGQGMNPTRGWQAGEVWRDRLTLRIDGPLNGPTRAAVQVRVTGDDVAVPPAGPSGPVEPPLVAETVVRPAAPLPLPGGANDAAPARPVATLAGSFDLLTWAVHHAPGDVNLTLWWRATAAPPADYTIFVHLVDAAGNLVAQADGVPNDGLSPTRIWQPGDVVMDTHRFPPGTVMPAGGRFLVGAYRPDTNERAPATLDGAPLPDNAVTIALGDEERLNSTPATEE